MTSFKLQVEEYDRAQKQQTIATGADKFPHGPSVSSSTNQLLPCSKAVELEKLGFHNKYYLGDKLGKGGFGCVYSAIKADKASGGNASNCADVDTDLAVKVVDLRFAKEDKLHKVLQNEVSIWSDLNDQPNCVALNEVFENDGLHYMVMERCRPLLSYMESLDDLQERTLGSIFVQMLMGIRQLHSMDVVHRDIKPDNFVVGGANGNTVKLCEFRLAKAIIPSNKVSGECGTAPFMCPEMIANQEYDTKADVWSFGVLVYVLLFGRFPYDPDRNNPAEMKLAIKEAKKKLDFGSCIPLSGNAIAFSMSLLQRDPKMRPSSSEAMQKKYMLSVLAGTHEQNKKLPSLRPVLRSARKVHAFANRALVQDDLDEWLDKLQSRAQNSQAAGSSTHKEDMQGENLRTKSCTGETGRPRPSQTPEMNGPSQAISRGPSGGRRNTIGDIDVAAYIALVQAPRSSEARAQNIESKGERVNSRQSFSTASTLASESSLEDCFSNDGSYTCDV